MPLRVRCNCGKAYAVKDELAGKKIRCKQCGESMLISQAEGMSNRSAKQRKSLDLTDDDEFGGSFGAASAATGALLPPRRQKSETASRPKAAEMHAVHSDTLEDRIAARTAAEVEDNVRVAPWKEMGSSILFFVIGALLFYYLDMKEGEGGMIRLPRILAVVYMTIGKWGVLAICWGISLLSLVAAFLAFTGVIRIYHSEDD